MRAFRLGLLLLLVLCTTATAAPSRTLTLASRHHRVLARMAGEVGNPASMHYRQVLSPGTFARRFGADIAALRRAARRQGLHLRHVSANHLEAEVSGSAARMARLPGVVMVSRPQRTIAAAGARSLPQPCADGKSRYASSGPGAQLAIADLGAAYGFSALSDAGVDGSGQTVGVFNQGAVRDADIDTFKACYGLTTTLTHTNVDPVGDSTTNEAQLDVETIMALAPKATVLHYGASSTIRGLTQMVADNKAKVLSFSYGRCEASGSDIASFTTQLQLAATQGQSVLFSSGDDGSAECFDAADATPNTGLTVSAFAALPGALAVGGTTLYAMDGANKVPYTPSRAPVEGIWSRGSSADPSGSGGGISTRFAMPSYQSGAAASLDVAGGGSGTPCSAAGGLCREIPDVAADASPTTGYRIFSQGAWKAIGGTSASAPLWAALLTLANSSPACAGHTVGFANPTLYSLAGTKYANNFNDITLPDPFSGNASNDSLTLNGGKYPVKPGYDMVTGLGSPKAPAIVAGLCNGGMTTYTVTVADPGPQTGTAGTAASLALTATDSGKAIVNFTATGLPPGLTLAPGGAVSGTPTTAGAYAVTVTGTDVQGNTGTRTFTWTITPGAAPTVTATATATPTATPTAPPAVPAKLVVATAHVAAKPTTAFTVNGTAITQIVVAPPAGVTLRGKPKVTGVGGVKLAFTMAGGRIKLAAPAATVRVSFGKGALKVSGKLRKKIKHHKVKHLRFGVTVVSAAGTTKLRVG